VECLSLSPFAVTLNGKPIAGAVLSLHKFLGRYSIEIAHSDPHPVARTIVAKDGSFTVPVTEVDLTETEGASV